MDTNYNAADEEVRKQMDAEELKQLQNLAARIDDVIRDFVANDGSAFIKLSTRRYTVTHLSPCSNLFLSPKDAAFATTKMQELLKEYIANSKAVGGSPEAEIEDITFFVSASCRCLSVKSGEEAMILLRRRYVRG